MILKTPSICALCDREFQSDTPVLLSSNTGGFLADLQPMYSAGEYAIWEMTLFSCPTCGYTTNAPGSRSELDEIPLEVKKVAIDTLSAFARRQRPSLDADPALTSKCELYALELDSLEAEDHLIADQFLKASWSARIRSRNDDLRRLQYLAAERYERALEGTAKDCPEDEVIARYLLVELYRLLDEPGRRQLHFDALMEKWGISIHGDVLIDIGKKQWLRPQDHVAIRADARVLDFLGYYRAFTLLSHGVSFLREGDSKTASRLFERLMGICEGPLKISISGQMAPRDASIFSPLDGYGFRGAVCLRECYKCMGISGRNFERIAALIRRTENRLGVSASEALRGDLQGMFRPRKSGWRHLVRSSSDQEPRAYSLSGPGSKLEETKERLRSAEEYLLDEQFVEASREALRVASDCEEAIAGLESRTLEHLDYASLRLRSQAIEIASTMSGESDTVSQSCIHRLEEALRAYPEIGGPRNNPMFAFLLSLLAAAYDSKGENETARFAWGKAWELVDNSDVELFHWGRIMRMCIRTAARAEAVLTKAREAGNLANSWTEGAASFELAELCRAAERNDDALQHLSRAVELDYRHFLSLQNLDIITDWPVGARWYRSYANSNRAKVQLRPPPRSGDRSLFEQGIEKVFGRICSERSTEEECRQCGLPLRYEPGDKILTLDWSSIHKWLSQDNAVGLACSTCGTFGACCWVWHTYDDWDTVNMPHYVPLCPSCGQVLNASSGINNGPPRPGSQLERWR